MKIIGTSLRIFLFFSVLTGIVYPVMITILGQLIFPFQSNGSIVRINGKKTGSELIAQRSDTPFYFSARPSAIDYNPLPSGGSNLGLTSKKLIETVDDRKKQFIAYNQLDTVFDVPPEMIFASASGLDPHISVRSALLQVDRIVKARRFTPAQKDQVLTCIQHRTEKPQFLILGEQRVNVLLLNLDIDQLK